jgi:uncharacterized protein YndB with AHSA1/START domain
MPWRGTIGKLFSHKALASATTAMPVKVSGPYRPDDDGHRSFPPSGASDTVHRGFVRVHPNSEGLTVDIEHELVVSAPIADVFACFSTSDGLNAWWTNTAHANSSVGGVYQFGFDAAHQWSGVVRVFDAPRNIEWEMTDTSPLPDWLGTRVGAQLTAEGELTRLHFYHRGWEGATPHHRLSSFCWAMYLRLLARYCTTGDVVAYESRNHL